MGVLRDGVDDSGRLRGADQLTIKRLCSEQPAADSVRWLQVDTEHPEFTVLDGKRIRHGMAFGKVLGQARVRVRVRYARASRRVAWGKRCEAGTLGTATRCDRYMPLCPEQRYAMKQAIAIGTA